MVMSGHSKWAQIKRQKGVNDTKRGLAFTKLSTAISLAVKQGGGIGDPNQNFKLRLAVDAARAQNMPKDNIERAIERGLGKNGAVMDEVVYEGFGPGGVAVIVEGATDNKNRTTSEVANVFNKNGGSMGQIGSVSYMFKPLGQIIIEKTKSLDEVFLFAAESGAEDVEESEDEFFIYTKPQELKTIREKFGASGYKIKETEIIQKPITPILFDSAENASRIIEFVEKLEENDDVQKVYANFEIKN